MSNSDDLAAGRQRPLTAWNETRVDYPESECIHSLFAQQAQRTPEAVAVVYEDQQLTYRQLNERADQLARGLQQLGVGPEVRVGICLFRSLEMVVGLYAIHKAGGAYVPMDPGYPAERLALMLEDAQVPVLLTQSVLLDLLPPTSAKLVCVDALEPTAPNSQPATLNLQPVTPENLAYVIYTSGSTGKPKGVMVRHRNVVNFFTGMDMAIGRDPGVWLAVTSISFDISVLELFWTLTRGFKVVLLGDEPTGSRLRALRSKHPVNGASYTAADQIVRHGVTHLQCTPSLAGMMVQDPKTMPALRHVKHFLFGGEPLPPALVAQLAGCGEIFNLYGPTETTIWSTVHPVTRNGGVISIGRPIANTQVYVLDEHLQPVPVGEAGELFIGGAGVVRGYLNRPELMTERFIPDPFSNLPDARLYRTGDLARHKPDGTLEFLGRLDQQVKVRGFRIELGEIEAAIRQHPDVQESAVSVWEARPNDKRLVGHFVPLPGAAIKPAELRRFLQGKLPDYMVPSVLTSLETLPLTPNGKFDRNALPLPQATRPTEYTRERQQTKGNNMSWFRRSKENKAGEPDAGKTIPLTEAQREIWYAAQISDAISRAFNLSTMVNLRGPLDPPRLSRAVRWLVDQNEALRATFSPSGDVQHIHAAMVADVPLTDLSLLPTTSRQSQLQRNLREAANELFDFARGPLFRTRLLRLAADEHILLITVHHSICDGSSLNILIHELGEHYSADIKGEPAPVRTRVTFTQFVLEAEAARQRPDRATAEAYWLAQYSRPAPMLELPTDRPLPAKRNFNGGVEAIILSPELSHELRRFSARHRCSLVAILLADYYLLLHRLTGQADLVVGLPMTSRSGDGGEFLVGHCVNFLPLRLSFEGNPTFVEHLSQVLGLLLEAHEHQNFTLGSLLQKLNLRRVPGRLPLVSVMINLDCGYDGVRLEGLETDVVTNPHGGCRFDLNFSLSESRGQLEVQCQYSAELFNPETIQRWLKHYEMLLAATVARPEQQLSELPPPALDDQPLFRNDSTQPAIDVLVAISREAGAPEGEPGASTDPPLNPTEEALARIWREVILVEEVGRNDNFFDLGGHSLLATQVIARITAALNVELPVRTIFESPTVAELAEAVSRAQREQPGGPTTIPRRQRGAETRKLQERLAGLSDTELQELLRNPKMKDVSL
jgi:amino acid adenylation domain-containing protein